MAPDTSASLALWKHCIYTDLGHTTNQMPVCLARVPFEVATHARVLGHAKPVGYTNLCNTANHTPMCEIVWSILTSIQFQHQGTHGRVT
ncbi:Formate--tetrahydrofolate ligase 1 [Gossypium arboreum]|uniref:Formate--tetrahydrofolate ligase 1 n=1 Tax=Gossypium arboreum TaxID=29729 RepID=A0A0B0N8H9_GOSAR|nr:Formate--tetrahydrofolate ligase 1 [Gossypium arboreum]